MPAGHDQLPGRSPGKWSGYDPTRISPDWAPPTDLRPRWLPWLAVILVTALVAGSLYLAERIGSTPAQTSALSYLPDDGGVAYQQRETVIGGTSTRQPLVTESARLTGAAMLSGLDFALGSRVLGVVGTDRLDRMRFWRTTTTSIGSLDTSQQLVRAYRADAAVELVAESGPAGADIFSPALVELPADVRPGLAWTSEGTLGAGRYRSEHQAENDADDCLRVRGTLTRLTATGQPGAIEQTETTWCRAAGPVRTRTTRGRATTTVRPASPPRVDPELRTVTEPWIWNDPVGWLRRDYDLMSDDLNLGSGAMAGSPSQLAPVLTASGLMFRVSSGDDVVGFTPKTPDRWTSLWRMHPGGTVLSAAAFGDVLVVTTSRRQVVGYSDAGVRLWSFDLSEVAFRSPVRIGDRQVALADSGGTVMSVELLTGERRWSHDLGADVSAPLIGDPRSLVAFDAGGTTTALDPSTGTPRWSVELEGEVGAVLGRTLVVRSAATLEGLDLTTGRRRWLRADVGTLDAVQEFGDVLVVSTQLRTVVLSEDGQVVNRLPPYESVTVVGSTLVGRGSTVSDIRDGRLALLRTIDTPDITLTSNQLPPLAYRHGVLVFGSGWAFTGWSDEP